MKRFLSVCVIGLISALVACQKIEPVIPEPAQQDILKLDNDAVAVTADGGTFNIVFKTNCNWSVSAQDDWISFSRVSGTASNAAFDITVRPNRGTETRSSKVVIKAGSKSAELTVTQMPHVDVPTDLRVTEKYEVGPEGGTVKVEFTTNKEWMVVASEPWMSVSASSGSSDDTSFEFTVGENPSVEPRSAILTITAEDKVAIISVTQAGNPKAAAQLDIDDALSFGYEGGSLTVDFVTNKNWTVSTEAEWLTISPASGTPEKTSFEVIAETNTESVKRTAEVVVTAGDKSVTISVGQDGAPAGGDVLVVEGDGNVSWEDGTVTVHVTASTDWTVTYLMEDGQFDWLYVRNSWYRLDSDPIIGHLERSVTDTSFNIDYNSNKSYEPRSRTLEITAGDKKVYFVLCQEAMPATELSVTDRDVVFGPGADSFTLNFKGSFAWTASANVPWITLSATEGVPETGKRSWCPDESHLDISVPDYDRGVKRVGTVTISSGGKTVNVTVTQMGVEVVEFEDALFKEYCLRYDTNHDGELDTKEAQAITDIDISLMPVTSVKGMESMPNLKVVEARYCKLKYIDFTKLYVIERFNFNDNEVTGVLDFSNCPRLTGIAADNNRVTGLIFKDNRLFEGFELANNCLSGVLDLTETSDDAYFFGLCGNPDLKEVIVKDEKFIEAIHCDEGVKVTVRH